MREIDYYAFGIDIGGTNTKIALSKVSISKRKIISKNLIDDFTFQKSQYYINFKLIDSTKILTLKNSEDVNKYFDELISVFEYLIDKNNLEKNYSYAFSFATPGFPDNKSKKVIGGSFNIPFLEDFSFKNFIEKYNSKYLYINMINDVTAQAYFEQIFNNYLLKEKDDIAILIALGTGIGGAIFSKDEVLMGKNGWSAEFGHIPLWFENLGLTKLKCTCGKTNCSEVFGSVGAYIRMLKEKNINLTAEQGLLKYIDGDCTKDIADVTEFWLDCLGALCGALINIFNPSVIIISGAISKIENLIDLIKQKTERYASKILYDQTIFLNSSAPELAGAIGAIIHGINNELE